jgi:hypothetical protein
MLWIYKGYIKFASLAERGQTEIVVLGHVSSPMWREWRLFKEGR